MRKLRVNIFDDDPTNLKLLASALSTRDYEVLSFNRPTDCPIYGDRTEDCSLLKPCADIIITDYQMPKMTGIEMLLQQAQRGCRVDVRNKAVLTGLLDDEKRKMIEELGGAFFSKPLRWNVLSAWLDECEKRIDLSKPVGIMRKEERRAATIDIVFAYNAEQKNFKGTVINFSDTGLCAKVYTPLTEGQSVVIKTKLPNDCGNASVRWARKMEADFYMIGLSCH